MSHEPGSRGWIMEQIGMVKVDVNNYKHAVAEENWKEADASVHRVVFRAENIIKYWPEYADRFRKITHSQCGIRFEYTEYIPDTGRFFHANRDSNMTELHVSDGATYLFSKPILQPGGRRESEQRTGRALLNLFKGAIYWCEHFRTSGTQVAASMGHRARAIYGFHDRDGTEMDRAARIGSL